MVNKNRQIPKGAYLIINSQVFQIKKPTITIGRKLDNDIVLQEDVISRVHAEIRFEENSYILYDLSSTAGTYVNKKKITECVLNSGDLISISKSNILFISNQPKFEAMSQDKTESLKDGED